MQSLPKRTSKYISIAGVLYFHWRYFAGYALFNGRPLSHITVVIGSGFIVFGVLNFINQSKNFRKRKIQALI